VFPKVIEIDRFHQNAFVWRREVMPLHIKDS
jgi:hypothetical protein